MLTSPAEKSVGRAHRLYQPVLMVAPQTADRDGRMTNVVEGATVPGDDEGTPNWSGQPGAAEPPEPTPEPAAQPAPEPAAQPAPDLAAQPAPEPWSADDTWPAGWYADPWAWGRERRWTGRAWTAETRGGHGPTVPALGGVAPPGPPVIGREPVSEEAAPTDEAARKRRRLVALVATLAAIGLVLGFTIAYVGADTTSKAANVPPTTLPTPSTTPATLVPPSNGSTPPLGGSTPGNGSQPGSGSSGSSGGGSSGSGSSGGGSAGSTDPSASILSRLVLRQSDVPSTSSVVLQNGGNALAQPTLDLCNGTYPSETLRTARLQVDLNDATGNSSFSTEAVLYKNAAASAQAFRELQSVVAHCPSTPVVSPVGEPTVTTTFSKAPDAQWPRVAGVDRQAYDFVVSDGLGDTARSYAVYLRRGRALIGLYFQEPTQKFVYGKATIPAVVKLFEQRLAAIPASAITP